jgi:tetratricopeptide (TPR) repeat protein
METKDYITLALAGAAFVFSITSFILTFRQRTVEDQRNTRKALTDVIAELSQVNIAFTQLDVDYPNNSMERRVVSFRRIYNLQRRYLANHGEFLADQIPELTTDIDCISLAGAFDSAGDYAKSQKFYELAVQKSPTNVLRMQNLRGFARFWFNQGNAALGRKTYEQALQLQLPQTDTVRQMVADTYGLWATIEEDHNFAKEAERLRELGRDAAKNIGNPRMRANVLEIIGRPPARSFGGQDSTRTTPQ